MRYVKLSIVDGKEKKKMCTNQPLSWGLSKVFERTKIVLIGLLRIFTFMLGGCHSSYLIK
jgi:hypothetical protein